MLQFFSYSPYVFVAFFASIFVSSTCTEQDIAHRICYHKLPYNLCFNSLMRIRETELSVDRPCRQLCRNGECVKAPYSTAGCTPMGVTFLTVRGEVSFLEPVPRSSGMSSKWPMSHILDNCTSADKGAILTATKPELMCGWHCLALK